MSIKSKAGRGRTKRAGYAVAPVTLAALTLGGVAIAAAGTGSSAPPQPSTEVGQQTRDTGTPLTFARTTTTPAHLTGLDIPGAVQQVVRGMGSAGPVRGVSVTPSANGPILEVQLAHSNDDVPDVWAAGLAVGAIGELTHTKQTALSQVIAAASATGPGKDGPSTWTGVGLGAAALGQSFNSPNDTTLSDRVNAVGQSFGLKVAALQILHPLESAIEVTFITPDATKINWTVDQLRAALVGSPISVEGVLIEVDSPTGEQLVRSGVAYRTGEGGLWCAPGQNTLCGNSMPSHMPNPSK